MIGRTKKGQKLFMLTDRFGVMPVWFVGFHWGNSGLNQPNFALVQFEPNGTNVIVPIKYLFKEDPYA